RPAGCRGRPPGGFGGPLRGPPGDVAGVRRADDPRRWPAGPARRCAARVGSEPCGRGRRCAAHAPLSPLSLPDRLPVTRKACDGAGLLAAYRAAVENLEAHVDEVNGLNVFPVPDGDTGSNMLATVRAALDEGQRVSGQPADRIAGAISYGALMGARGNSGVITSQIFRGMAEGLGGKRRFNGLDLAHALTIGTQTAYGAVVKPVEGTILTVIREAAAAAVTAAELDGAIETVLVARAD